MDAQINEVPIAKPNKSNIVDLVDSFDSSNCNIKLVGSYQGTANDYYVADAFYCTVQKTAIYTVYYKKEFRYLKTWDISNAKQLPADPIGVLLVTRGMFFTMGRTSKTVWPLLSLFGQNTALGLGFDFSLYAVKL